MKSDLRVELIASAPRAAGLYAILWLAGAIGLTLLQAFLAKAPLSEGPSGSPQPIMQDQAPSSTKVDDKDFTVRF